MKSKRLKEYKKYLDKQVKEITKDPIKSLELRPSLELAIKFFTPWIIGISTLYILTTLGYDFVSLVEISGVYIFNPVGAAMGVPYAVSLELNSYAALIYMLILDAVASAFIILNIDFLKLVPFLGKLIKRFMDYTQKLIEKRPWMKGLEFIGVFTFVLVPYPLTGSVAGAFMGKLLGMEDFKTWLAVILGAAVRLIIYFGLVNGLQILL